MQVKKVSTAFKKGYRIINGNVVYTPTGNIRKLFRENRNEPGFMAYPNFSVKIKNKVVKIYAHQLSAYQKYGKKACADGIIVRHKSNDIMNFSPENILIGTQKQNIMDQSPETRRANALKASRQSVRVRLNKNRFAVLEYMEDF